MEYLPSIPRTPRRCPSLRTNRTDLNMRAWMARSGSKPVSCKQEGEGLHPQLMIVSFSVI
eukprot:5584613-Amphidinium_carterae.1